jgi:hypothetical protein
MEHPYKDLEDKENKLRKAIGLPPAPKWSWKREADYTEEDFKMYMDDIIERSKRLYKTQSSQEAYVKKERENALKGAWWAIAKRAKQKKTKLKSGDSVVITDGSDISAATVDDIAELVSRKTRDKIKKEKDPLSGTAPVLSDLVANRDDQEKKTQDRPMGERLARFERDVFRNAFPILSKVVESFESKKRIDNKEKSRTEMRERRALDRTEQTAVALESLSREQEKSVDLLGDLLDAVKQLSQQRQMPTPGKGRLGRSVKSLRRVLPFLLGGAAIAGGAYGLYRLMQDDEDESSTEEQPQAEQQQTSRETPDLAQRISFDYDSGPSLMPKDPISSSATPAKSGIDLSGSLKSITANDKSPEPMVKSPVSGGSSGTYLAKEPAPAVDLGSQLDAPAVENLSRSLALKATRVTLRGGEIRIAGTGSQIGNASSIGKSAAAGDLSFAPGVDSRISDNIAQKLERVEGDSGKDLTITSGFRDPSRNRAAGGAEGSAHTRGNAVDVRFPGNEQETAEVIESAKKAGVGGIGVYGPGFLHLDTESSRAWGPDHTSRSIPEWAKPALDGKSIGPTASPIPSGGGTGAAVMGASQENAVAEKTPMAPTVVTAGSSETGTANPGLQVPSSGTDQNDPGNVEPDDAAERYSRLFNMAA